MCTHLCGKMTVSASLILLEELIDWRNDIYDRSSINDFGRRLIAAPALLILPILGLIEAVVRAALSLLALPLILCLANDNKLKRALAHSFPIGAFYSLASSIICINHFIENVFAQKLSKNSCICLVQPGKLIEVCLIG